MAFPRLLASLILLLYWTTSSVGSHDFTSSDLSPPRVKRDQPFETREKVQGTFQAITDSLIVLKDASESKQWRESTKKILMNLSKFASMAPGCVGALFSAVNMVLAFIPQDDPVLNAVNKGFAQVNRKLDSISNQISNLATDVEWFNYASVYSQDEVRILSTWRKLIEFRKNSELAQSQEDKLRQAEIFTNFYEYTGTEGSVANLYHYLTVSSTSLSGNLNELLKRKFKCDIHEIGKYNFYFNSLLLKGTVLNEVYWKLIGLKSNREDEHVQMFKDLYAAQVAVVDFCINNTEKHMKEDVTEISNANSHDNKAAIAELVKKKLDEKYDWYEWVVLVYNTDDDTSYALFDLNKIYVASITVAVGHVLKSEEVFRSYIIGAARQCFNEGCNIQGKLDDCGFDVQLPPPSYSKAYLPLKNLVKATHITYATDYVVLPKPFHKISCQYNTLTVGWIAMYYSTPKKSICDDNSCQNNGQCKRLLDSNDHVCECQDGYYGDTCEELMDRSLVKNIVAAYPVPTITTTYTRMKTIESKLGEVLTTINDKCG